MTFNHRLRSSTAFSIQTISRCAGSRDAQAQTSSKIKLYSRSAVAFDLGLTDSWLVQFCKFTVVIIVSLHDDIHESFWNHCPCLYLNWGGSARKIALALRAPNNLVALLAWASSSTRWACICATRCELSFAWLWPSSSLRMALLSGDSEREGYPDEQGVPRWIEGYPDEQGVPRWIRAWRQRLQKLSACSLAAFFDMSSSSLTVWPSCSSTSLRATMPNALEKFFSLLLVLKLLHATACSAGGQIAVWFFNQNLVQSSFRLPRALGSARFYGLWDDRVA